MPPAPEQSKAQRTIKLERRQRHRRMPWRVKLLRFTFRWIGPLLPGLTSHLMYYLWFKTYRHPPPTRELQWLKHARQSHIKFEQQDICLYQWGTGKTILLAHGWNGRGSQLAGFVSALQNKGFSVLAYDAPGHGKSTGRATNGVQIARLIAQLDREYGPFDAVISHSLGVPACLNAAVNNGLRLTCFVGISGPGDLPFLIKKYTAALRIPKSVIRRFMARLTHDFGPDWENRLATTCMARQLSCRSGSQVKSLIIHDSDDLDIPTEHGQAIARALHNAGFTLTSGLGHRRILRSPAVIDLVVRFVHRCSESENRVN